MIISYLLERKARFILPVTIMQSNHITLYMVPALQQVIVWKDVSVVSGYEDTIQSRIQQHMSNTRLHSNRILFY